MTERTDTLYIRARHPNGYRKDQWAKVISVSFLPRILVAAKARDPRPVYTVEFVDGVQDLWAVYNPEAEYEFSGNFAGGSHIYNTSTGASQ